MKDTDNIGLLLNPGSIAILGCSDDNRGGKTLKNLQAAGYEGRLYPVHPKHSQVLGLPCYPSLADIPGQVDCCIVALRSTLILTAIEEMHAKGIKAAVLFASGFAELGEEGRTLQKTITEKLKAYGIAACGPNCLGLINLHDKIPMYAAAFDLADKAGPVGVVAHSGSACIAITSAGRGLGYSYVVSCGNEAGLSVGDYFRAMAADPRTRIMVGYLEALRNPQDLADAAAVARQAGKPIVILRVGKSEVGQKTAAAHSGALAGSNVVIDAFFERHGILTANSFDELFEICEILLKLGDRLPTRRQVALTAISGGQLGFSSDIAERAGVPFAAIGEDTVSALQKLLPGYASAANPLDVTTALFEPSVYSDCVKVLAADDAVGMVVVCQDSEAGLGAKQVALYRGIMDALAQTAGEIDKPLAVFSPIGGGLHPSLREPLDKAGVPLLMGADESMKAVAALELWARYRRLPAETGGACEATSVFDFGGDKSLSESRSKALLAAYGIPTAREALVSTEEEAVAAARDIGFPVVMKVDSPDILHKTEAKVVGLGVADEESVRRVYREILANAKAYDPAARISGVSVQEMVTGGVEMLLGAKNDPLYGPTVMVGVGGIFVEVFRDFSLKLAPVDKDTALDMINGLKGAKLLHGARGAKPADVDALADALVRLSRLVDEHRAHIAEMDINPILVLEKGRGVRAVDALVVQQDK